MRDLEPGQSTSDPGLASTRLARALCTDADLYGGHPCLSCQAAARRLADRAAGDLPLAGAESLLRIQGPPHGTNQRTARSYWAAVLAATADPAAAAPG